MLEALDDYDWAEAFGYAGPDGNHGDHSGPMLVEGATCSDEPFTRADVAEILHIREGESDGPNWLLIGRLNDGRFFYLTAGCDYTGWD